MYFSEYVVSERASSFLDPLGFMRPAGVLQDQLFKQFTVLSNHPAYHGVLCVILRFLSRRAPGCAPTGRDFRRAEILWGVLNALRKSVVINIRKYARLVEDGDTVRLATIPATHSLYAHLGYGTLGHYARPSMTWGLLHKDGRQLTSVGERLAQAAAVRHGVNLDEWLARWMDLQTLDVDALDSVAQRFHLGAPPADDERAVWADLIERWTAAHPATLRLWTDPLEPGLLQGADTDAERRDLFLATLPERYPDLREPLAAAADFEALSGVVQFVFDLRLARMQYAAEFADLPQELKQELADCAVDWARGSLPARQPRLDTGGVFARMAELPRRYEDLDELVTAHHVRHQRAKGVSPFIADGELQVRGQINRTALGLFLEEFVHAAGPVERRRLLRFRSRRDWHFGRCRRYHDYAHRAGA